MNPFTLIRLRCLECAVLFLAGQPAHELAGDVLDVHFAEGGAELN